MSITTQLLHLNKSFPGTAQWYGYFSFLSGNLAALKLALIVIARVMEP